jgi:prophage antirepressor-like protein
MATNIQVFHSQQFGDIRTAGTADKPMFCLADICKVLELQPGATKNRLGEKGITLINTPTAGGEQQLLYISEQNLYKVIMRSNKPQAEPFQDWVCGDVLPAIRRTGGYIAGHDQMTDEQIMASALVIAQRTIERRTQENRELRQENHRLENENTALLLENQELRNDKNYLDIIMHSSRALAVTQIAQDYGMSAKALNKQLAQMRIQYSCNGQWILYQRYKDKGYQVSNEIELKHSDGTPFYRTVTEWTQAGRRFLYEQLKAVGILPQMEKEKS